MAFRFKQFFVEDEHASMKVGTDAVLLGAWAGTGTPAGILDVGTGCGIIALMMAQRYAGAFINAIDLHKPSIDLASLNFRHSEWSDRLTAIKTTLQEHVSKQLYYDLIVSNPPYFIDSLLPPDPSKTIAKHNTTLTLSELVSLSRRMLSATGRLCLILPADNQALLEKHTQENGLFKSRHMDIMPLKGKKINRVLSEWVLTEEDTEYASLTIRNTDKSYTAAYCKLTIDFYLAL